MNQNIKHVLVMKAALKNLSTPEKAAASKRYFPNGINCIGVTAPDIKCVILKFQTNHPSLSAKDTLEISELLLQHATYSEEKLLAFGLLNKFVKKHFDENLLQRFKYWLENYADNWSHVDDLCIKTIYHFFMARPELIHTTQHWAYSTSPWCRRASNVVWVKFIKRTIGKSTYYLDKHLIFNNCTILLNDEDEFVQKSIGWLLKVTSVHYEKDVIHFIETNIANIPRETLRYAVEKLDKDKRKRLLTLSI